ncbi:prostate and testis expressed protein 4 [Grammomys surdaster]|uniref:prostate and testis expressed protein 4 n=1 Tax=Grammomys surdaster TaxID=491861 RepID=UPI0010A0A98D|nr:prostate and testis expressed protein 4 [Grammomys surdaster]
MNPVTKIGIALILTLSFLCFVEGLICHECKKSKDSRCIEKAGRCTVPDDGSCFTYSQFYDSNHEFSRHGCESACQDELQISGKTVSYKMCCQKNLCNSY